MFNVDIVRQRCRTLLRRSAIRQIRSLAHRSVISRFLGTIHAGLNKCLQCLFTYQPVIASRDPVNYPSVNVRITGPTPQELIRGHMIPYRPLDQYHIEKRHGLPARIVFPRVGG